MPVYPVAFTTSPIYLSIDLAAFKIVISSQIIVAFSVLADYNRFIISQIVK
jgi:hypothetical protein